MGHARYKPCVVGLLLLSHAGLLAWSAPRHSPTWDEPGHLVAGISHWQLGTFDLYRANHPLVRMVAGLPVLVAGAENDWSRYDASVGARSERSIRIGFVEANRERVFWLHTLGRWACIPFSVLGAYVCFAWARQVYGDPAGMLALTLWCFSPNVLAHAQMITPDAGAAALGVAAAYLFWRWLKGPTWGSAAAAGLMLGLAELTKTTWIVLFGLWPLLWIVWQWAEPKAESGREKGGRDGGGQKAEGAWGHQAGQMAVILLVGLYVLNLGYGFEGSFQRLGDYGFVSETLGGPKDDGQPDTQGRNHFVGTWLAYLPVPLPKNYVMGIDLQKWDFERKMWSYLGGEWRMGGWWYYYLYALVIKVPLGTWALILLALLVRLFLRGYSTSWRDELVLLAPAAVVLTLVSSQTGFNHHLRYVLPIFPFAFIWASKVARAVQFGHRKTVGVAGAALLWSVGSSLYYYPHSLSYFNELVGGPTGGHAHLGGIPWDSNIDWGQDLLYLKRWLDDHPEARPLHLAFNGVYEASIAGIEYTLPPTEPEPGWHALSVNKIRSRTREYEYFLRFKPVAMAGYSIYIYNVSLEEANRVRRELEIEELPEDWQPPTGGDDG